jgi:hypothetical protein
MAIFRPKICTLIRLGELVAFVSNIESAHARERGNRNFTTTNFLPNKVCTYCRIRQSVQMVELFAFVTTKSAHARERAGRTTRANFRRKICTLTRRGFHGPRGSSCVITTFLEPQNSRHFKQIKGISTSFSPCHRASTQLARSSTALKRSCPVFSSACPTQMKM